MTGKLKIRTMTKSKALMERVFEGISQGEMFVFSRSQLENGTASFRSDYRTAKGPGRSMHQRCVQVINKSACHEGRDVSNGCQ